MSESTTTKRAIELLREQVDFILKNTSFLRPPPKRWIYGPDGRWKPDFTGGTDEVRAHVCSQDDIEAMKDVAEALEAERAERMSNPDFPGTTDEPDLYHVALPRGDWMSVIAALRHLPKTYDPPVADRIMHRIADFIALVLGGPKPEWGAIRYKLEWKGHDGSWCYYGTYPTREKAEAVAHSNLIGQEWRIVDKQGEED